MMTERQYTLFAARLCGSKGAFKCPSCKRGFVTRLGLAIHPDVVLCYKCYRLLKQAH